MVGKGSNIDIWTDSSVPTLPNFRVLPGVKESEVPRYMHELITNTNSNVEKLEEWFSEWECEVILKIPIPMNQCESKWCWHFSKNGDFSVRSAYYMELTCQKSELASISTEQSSKVWKILWHAQVPTKNRHFGWRTLYHGLPLHEMLYRKGITARHVVQIAIEASLQCLVLECD